jgi:hypothetical protein
MGQQVSDKTYQKLDASALSRVQFALGKLNILLTFAGKIINNHDNENPLNYIRCIAVLLCNTHSLPQQTIIDYHPHACP